MNKKTKTLILSIEFTLVLLLTFTITYAAFVYQKKGDSNQQLVLGGIYMHYGENNQLTLNNAMPQEGVKSITVYTPNQIMATQTVGEINELTRCVDLVTKWDWEFDEGTTAETFCRGEGTVRGGMTLEEDIDDWQKEAFLFGYDFLEDGGQELLDANVIVEKDISYTNFEINPVMGTQAANFENELTACVYFFEIREVLLFDEGSSAETYCQGIGTQYGGYTFQDDLDDWMLNDEYFFEYLSSNNIIIQNGDSYIVNPDMANQVLGDPKPNELMNCIEEFKDSEFDEGSTVETFCRGTGTIEGLRFQDSVKQLDNNQLTYWFLLNMLIPKMDLPYFEFTISGKNTYSKKDIYYDVVLRHGDDHETRNTRIEDKFLRFTLTEVLDDDTEKEIFTNKKYSSIENRIVHVETIPKNTMNEINKKYRLYMWIDENVVIGNINSDYKIEEWNDVFASVKVNVSGDFLEKEIDVEYEEKYDVTDSSCFETNEITTYTYNNNMNDDELELCITYVTNFDWSWNYGTTPETFCKGNGIYSGLTFNEILNKFPYWFSDDDLVYFEENNISTSRKSLGIRYYYTHCGSDIVIPKTINGLNVTRILDSTFRGDGLTSVVIPNTITMIEQYAFYDNDLISVIFEKNSKLTTIGPRAFEKNQITKIEIPDSVIDIESRAFRQNELTFIKIPESVIKIGNSAFAYNQLQSVTFEDNSHLERIEFEAFQGEEHTIKEVTIPNSVSYLDCLAFNDDVIIHKSDNLKCEIEANPQ